MGTRIALLLVWLLHFLPFRLLALVGHVLGLALFLIAGARRRVVLINLALCFPRMSEADRRRLARAHFAAFTRSVLDRGIAWWSSRERLTRVVRVEGWEHLRACTGRPVVLLAPHFVGLDIGAQRLAAEHSAVSMYSRQKNPLFDAFLREKRNRFGSVTMVSRQQGLRPVLRAMRKGLPLYYLPDMDLGARDSVFVPFFGVQAATVPALSRIVRLTGAVVLPCITEQLPGGAGYRVRIHPPWTGVPASSEPDDAGDALAMNAFIESAVAGMPAQYHWLHKRFKTRPPGEPPPY
ncbi:MAG: lipid A biosynthesis acyltransferase [Rhodocyclaceae bacterium]|jgi:KDO2-lipid IV(A) lauroyltransferase|nr:lipid A biosynthesis acyltransferase [Rhodocyclaceae bacterium]MCE2979635.1 lipid A biosynthesis acyltransferase [Betaproteobacteria bacterium]MCA3075348.1 lipid A biosynthesis acyltransferase [Rhodocyclaceae bacterium]MCA3091833.1 lipid A biosynthesis acyltransferase [Rhodocyclaceae bacterium]MCA3093273.1 lipid A biosynthesis acyltransferase [Rhodocyclaceae bacterium]